MSVAEKLIIFFVILLYMIVNESTRLEYATELKSTEHLVVDNTFRIRGLEIRNAVTNEEIAKYVGEFIVGDLDRKVAKSLAHDISQQCSTEISSFLLEHYGTSQGEQKKFRERHTHRYPHGIPNQ